MNRINIKKITDELVAAEDKDWKERHAAWVEWDKAKKQMPEWIAYKRLKDNSPSPKERHDAWVEFDKAKKQMPELMKFKKLKNEYDAKWGELGKLIEN